MPVRKGRCSELVISYHLLSTQSVLFLIRLDILDIFMLRYEEFRCVAVLLLAACGSSYALHVGTFAAPTYATRALRL